jgi:uncharacterized protein GlcG (DUF336 family)/mono/diheme cytochrome c family protein
MAAPMTYRVGGEQYVSVMAGAGAAYEGYADSKYGSLGRIVTFKLNGSDVPLRPLLTKNAAPAATPALPPPGTPEQVANGRALYERNCALCHAQGRAPDLSRMSAATHAEFGDILLKGTRVAKGMPNFGNALSQGDVEAIHAFVIDIASKEKASAPPQADGQPLAQRFIASCETYAVQNKLTPLSIAVVDESGSLVAFTRQKGASPVTAEVAVMKAKSAARVGAPTAVLAQVAAEDQAARDTYSLLQLVAMPGAWPFADSDGTVRGAVGVSGALAKDDSACAQHAVESNR